MKITDYCVAYDQDSDRRFYVSIIDVPWYREAWYQLWEKIDPCCRRPWRFWTIFLPIFYRAVDRRFQDKDEVKIEVTQEWAEKHYDWDWKKYDYCGDEDDER